MIDHFLHHLLAFASNSSETFETIGSIILIFPYLLALKIGKICLLKILERQVSLIALNPKAEFGDLVRYLSIEGTFVLPISNVLIVSGFPLRYFNVFNESYCSFSEAFFFIHK